MCIQQVLAVNLRNLYEKITGQKIIMCRSYDSAEWYLDHSCYYSQERYLRIVFGLTRIEIYELNGLTDSYISIHAYESPTLVSDILSELLKTETTSLSE